MVDRDPILFREWNTYMKHRQIMASSIVLKSSGWNEWNTSHAKLLGVLLWEYEGTKVNGFKYKKTLRRHAYRRTHNYRLLNGLLRGSIIVKAEKGNYSLNDRSLKAAERAITVMKQADAICKEEAKNCPIQWNNIL